MPRAAPTSCLAALVENTAVAEQFRVPIICPAERPLGSIGLMIASEHGAVDPD